MSLFDMLQASSRIIGRQGSFIKQLQRESACKINTLKDVELRSGLKARVLSVCGNNYAMSKGLYLVARKIASRWEYAPEWEGGDPTVERGDGMPPGRSAPGSASQGQSSYGGNPNHAKYDNMDLDSPPPAQRRQRGGQRSRGGRVDDLDSYGRYDRDGGGRGGDRDGGGRGDRDGGGRGSDRRQSGGDRSGGGGNNDRSGGSREHRFSRGGREPAPLSSAPGNGPPGPTAANPWVDPALLASVVGSTTAAGGAPPVGSAEAWQRLLGQIPTSARESLGIPAPQLGTQAPIATDVYAQVVGAQQQQQQQQQQAMQQPQQVVLLFCPFVFSKIFFCGC